MRLAPISVAAIILNVALPALGADEAAAAKTSLPESAQPVSANKFPDQWGPYLQSQRLVAVGGGRTINLVCLGVGSPTVILTAGEGLWSFQWRKLQEPLSHHTRVCAWDRANFGFSSTSSETQDIIHTTTDLERALRSDRIDGPYVMVGHSFGAYETLRFADRHRRAVVGIVLIDPSIPDQMNVIKTISPRLADFLSLTAPVARVKKCAEEVKGGLRNGMPDPDKCFQYPPPGVIPDSFKAVLVAGDSDWSRRLARASILQYTELSSHEIVNPKRNYGDMPLIVLTAGIGPNTSNTPDYVKAAVPAYRQAFMRGHDAYAALSKHGRNQIVADSAHLMTDQKPEAIFSAITEVISDATAR